MGFSVKIKKTDLMKKAVKSIERHIERNLDRAAIFLEGDIVSKFPGSGTPGGRSGATRAAREANRSKDGKIPHVQTGRLKGSIGHDKPRDLVRRVGTGIGGKTKLGYGLFLEFGTSKMAARPWLRPAIKRNKGKLGKILGRKK